MPFVIDKVELPLSGSTRVFEGSQYCDTHVSFFLVDTPPGDGPDLHTHPCEEIFVVQEGQVTITVGDATIEAIGGQIVIAPAGTPHKFVSSGAGPFRSINIHPNRSIVTTWPQD